MSSRIKDLALMPFEIEVHPYGYTLLRIGTVEADGPNKGYRKEITEGYYSKIGLAACLQKIIADRMVTPEQKFTLETFLNRYVRERNELTGRVEAIVKKIQKVEKEQAEAKEKAKGD